MINSGKPYCKTSSLLPQKWRSWFACVYHATELEAADKCTSLLYDYNMRTITVIIIMTITFNGPIPQTSVIDYNRTYFIAYNCGYLWIIPALCKWSTADTICRINFLVSASSSFPFLYMYLISSPPNTDIVMLSQSKPVWPGYTAVAMHCSSSFCNQRWSDKKREWSGTFRSAKSPPKVVWS